MVLRTSLVLARQVERKGVVYGEAEWHCFRCMFSEGWRMAVVGTHIGWAAEDWRHAVGMKLRLAAVNPTTALPSATPPCQFART